MRPARSSFIGLSTLLVAGGLLAGCTTAVEPLPPVERHVPAPLADHDAVEVRTALAGLDPCALLDSTTSEDLGIDGSRRWRDMFACAIPDQVRVEMYAEFDQHQRFWEDAFALSGVKAYRNSEASNWCTISIPVDHEHAIVFSQDSAEDFDCTAPEAFAARALESMSGDPSALGRRDDDGIVACEVFAPIIGTPPDGTVIVPGEGAGTGLERCGVWRQNDSGFVPVDPEQGLLFRYSAPLADQRSDGEWDDYPLLTIDGTDVLLFSSDPEDKTENDGQCRLLWDATTTSARSEADVIRAEVEARTCTDAISLAEEAVPAVRAAKPVSAPSSLPLYSGDENDGPAVGACADVLDQAERRCAPASDSVEVPDSPAEVVMESEADPNVLCAAARETVQSEFKPTLAAVTAAREPVPEDEAETVCEFVEPRHSLVVRIQAQTEELEATAPRGSSYSEVNGHSAIIDEVESEGWNSWRRARIALGEAAEPGYLDIEISTRPDRRQGIGEGATVDTSALDTLEELSVGLTDELLEK